MCCRDGGVAARRRRRPRRSRWRPAADAGGDRDARREAASSRPPSTSAPLKSRRSTTIQPQVEGFITRIAVRSGERVAAGRAAVRDRLGAAAGRARHPRVSTRAVRDGRPAPTRASKLDARRRRCYAAGAVEPARARRRPRRRCGPPRRSSKALDEQIRAAADRARLLPRHGADRRHRRRHPGARRAIASRKTTVLTTIDENAGLEVYINVPVQQAPSLKLGLPVRIVDDAGKRARRPTRSRSSRRRSTRDADGAGQGAAGRRTRRASAPISSCARSVVWTHGAGPDACR